MSLCAIGKESDEINQQLPTYIVCKNGSSYLDDLKMANYKYTLETILTNDISFYQKLYDTVRYYEKALHIQNIIMLKHIA